MAYSYCPECQNKYQSFEICPECEIPLRSLHLNQTISGDQNQAVQINGDNQGDIVIQQTQETDKPATTIYRQSIKPIRVNGTPFKNIWLFITGGLGILGSLASVLSYLNNFNINNPLTSSNWMLYVTIISVLLLITAFLLHRQKYITLLFGHTLEKDRCGNLYLTKVGGTCGICKEPVRIKTVGPREFRQTRVECTNNPDQHWWEFDRTVLGDVGEDYKNNQQQE